MQYGFGAPVSGALARPQSLARIVAEGEAMSYASCTISDHVVIPTDIHARYPYSDTGEFPSRSRGDRHEQLTAAAFIAAKTSRLKLVTSVTVVPHRPAVLLAKILATIDVLSEGRLVFGIGAGWMKEEFEALGLPPFAERGAVTDEYLAACRELWTRDKPRFDGKYVKFSEVLFDPKPVQQPHPPIWVGGESGPALRRTAKLGDGWYPIGTNPQFRLDTMKRYEAGVARLKGLVREQGRDPAQVTLAYRVTQWGKALPLRADDGERRLFSGENADMIGDLRAFRDLGVAYVDFNFEGATAEQMLDNMRRFREDVLAKV
ncbi:MAG TPA: TIGR03619 family F420-dependent LLM class oxidoreductase [Stellaceae bacterium]|nr:TIGR03619 family F420-dependent LLM class oxidoreductase [Stellaceae bacterium]